MKDHFLIAPQSIQIFSLWGVRPKLGNTGLAESLVLLEEQASNTDSSLKILAAAQDQQFTKHNAKHYSQGKLEWEPVHPPR
jgi:hypothetical protein